MPRAYIDDVIVITYDYSTFKEKYWSDLSSHIHERHGKKEFTNHLEVENILLDGFQFFVNEFRKLIEVEKGFSFYLYVFWLHEESMRLLAKISTGLRQNQIGEVEFARYRRILKLILEQGCDTDLTSGSLPNAEQVQELDDKIQKLLYLGTWIYEFADFIAYHKMVDEYYCVKYDSNGIIIDWQHHFQKAYKTFILTIPEAYKNATVDEMGITDFKQAIEDCFGINYDYAFGVIFKIKHDLGQSNLQTIQPNVLPYNLAKEFKIDEEIAQAFYNGLTISRHNKLSIEDAVYKPYSPKRYLFRPILIYQIDGEERALIGEGKFLESVHVHSTNAIQWNLILDEWKTVKSMEQFINKKGKEHDKILEDKIEEVIKSKSLMYHRNIKSFKQLNGIWVNIDNEKAGEIDFIIINSELNKIFVADSKYNKVRYEAVGYRADYSTFTKNYEPKIDKKVSWIAENIPIVEEHFKIIYNLNELDLSGYDVEGVFFINTPTFYMFNGRYKAITLNQVSDYICGKLQFPKLEYKRNFHGQKFTYVVQHPYFRKP